MRKALDDAHGKTPGTGPAAVRPIRRLVDKLGDALRATSSRIDLVGDSLLTMMTELTDRRSVYRALAERQSGGPGRMPPTWKGLKGHDGWWERHVETGRDDRGRIYAHLADSARWRVLVSTKAKQLRDLERIERF